MCLVSYVHLFCLWTELVYESPFDPECNKSEGVEEKSPIILAAFKVSFKVAREEIQQKKKN